MENTERIDVVEKGSSVSKPADKRDSPLLVPVAVTPLARVESILSRRSSAAGTAQHPSDIEHASTYESSSDDDYYEEEDDVGKFDLNMGGGVESERHLEMDETSMNDFEKRKPDIIITKTPWEEFLHQALYISGFAIVGTIFRVYVARIFGQDCELRRYNESALPQDFLSPFSSLLCITNSGKYANGGALFVDLPANMLGSFVMGVLSPHTPEHPLPWFHSEHPLQQHTSFHLGLKVGLCGCLTTFSSWNTQMVMMLDGTETALGPQVASALFGYAIGVACAVSSFLFGRITFGWLQSRHPEQPTDAIDVAETLRHSNELPEEPTNIESSGHDSLHVRVRQSTLSYCRQLLGITYGPFIVAGVILGACLVADFVVGNHWYRKIWMAALLTPPGAVLRWKLSGYHTAGLRSVHLEWLPLGTLLVNLLAACISATAHAVNAETIEPSMNSKVWTSALIFAVETGFAGSLSTVSTLMREMFFMDHRKANVYCFMTLVCGMFLALLFYSPIIRYG